MRLLGDHLILRQYPPDQPAHISGKIERGYAGAVVRGPVLRHHLGGGQAVIVRGGRRQLHLALGRRLVQPPYLLLGLLQPRVRRRDLRAHGAGVRGDFRPARLLHLDNLVASPEGERCLFRPARTLQLRPATRYGLLARLPSGLVLGLCFSDAFVLLLGQSLLLLRLLSFPAFLLRLLLLLDRLDLLPFGHGLLPLRLDLGLDDPHGLGDLHLRGQGHAVRV
mmetsp:Transcript_37541/g.90555  ORF Transcript_37541/g.90555 Transcript_37541/m.90555 type:complete len:222 (-) Transcript_37541:946-1611(-)